MLFITVNGYSISGSYIAFENTQSETFTVVATDSRGYTNTIELKPIIIPYIPLSATAKFDRLSATSSEVKVKYSGNYYNGSFGSEDNELTITWAYKEKDSSDWIGGGTLTPTIENNTFSGEASLGTIFNYKTAYDFMLNISDKLSAVSPQETVKKGETIFDYGVDANGNNYFWINGDLYVGGYAEEEQITPIKPTIQACYTNNTLHNNYSNSNYISFKRKLFDNSNGKIVFGDNGLITINHTGYIKVSFNVWIWGGSNARPWLQFLNYDTRTTYIETIDDISSGYNNYSASDCIIPVTAGDKFGLVCRTADYSDFKVDSGNGSLSSYITIELI